MRNLSKATRKLFTRPPTTLQGDIVFSRVCLFTGGGGSHVTTTNYTIAKSQAIWGTTPALLKLIHLGPSNPHPHSNLTGFPHGDSPTPSCSLGEPPQDYFRLVHYEAHTSDGWPSTEIMDQVIASSVIDDNLSPLQNCIVNISLIIFY